MERFITELKAKSILINIGGIEYGLFINFKSLVDNDFNYKIDLNAFATDSKGLIDPERAKAEMFRVIHLATINYHDCMRAFGQQVVEPPLIEIIIMWYNRFITPAEDVKLGKWFSEIFKVGQVEKKSLVS